MKTLQPPPLNEGETYIGAIGDQTGEVYHIILLPGDHDDSDWQAAMDWAAEVGISPNALAQRLYLGWSVERAITTPIKNGGSQ